MLFHVSEQADIDVFERRWSESAGQRLVWAIDEDHLRNYLLPRECPRVTFYAGAQTASALMSVPDISSAVCLLCRRELNFSTT
jgi:hypothetical protein